MGTNRRLSLASLLGAPLWALLGAGCSEDAPSSTVPPKDEVILPITLAEVPCRYVVPRSVEGEDFWCGDLEVAENRAKDGSRIITLHAIVFRGKADGPTTVMLEGGPGGSAEQDVTGLAMRDPRALARFSPYLALGDVVFFDQRGVGRSVPRLTCVPESNSDVVDPAKACFDRLVGDGVDLAGYDSANSADDVAELATALGRQKVNLHGISYGTRLALEVLRRHGDRVRGAVIDGVLPAQSKVFTETIPNLDATITKIFDACAADARCIAAYPDLENALERLRTKLETTPFTTGGFTLDWNTFVGFVFDTLYSPEAAGQLPYFITTLLAQSQSEWEADQAKKNERASTERKARNDALRATPLGGEVLARLDGPEGELHDEVTGDLAFAMYAAVSCADSGQYESRDDALAALNGVRPSLRAFGEAEVRSSFAACRTLPTTAARSDAMAPVESAVPTLVIGGGFDPITPAKNAELVATTLSNHQLVLVPGGAHGQVDVCGVGVKAKYLETLEPVDATCATSQALEFHYGSTTKTFHARRRSVR